MSIELSSYSLVVGKQMPKLAYSPGYKSLLPANGLTSGGLEMQNIFYNHTPEPFTGRTICELFRDYRL